MVSVNFYTMVYAHKDLRYKIHLKGDRMIKEVKEVQVKLMKGLLDLIVLQFLSTKPMHGYQIITRIRENFGVYFGSSTIYPLLNSLEKRGCVKSEWEMHNERPRKFQQTY